MLVRAEIVAVFHAYQEQLSPLKEDTSGAFNLRLLGEGDAAPWAGVLVMFARKVICGRNLGIPKRRAEQ